MRPARPLSSLRLDITRKKTAGFLVWIAAVDGIIVFLFSAHRVATFIYYIL